MDARNVIENQMLLRWSAANNQIKSNQIKFIKTSQASLWCHDNSNNIPPVTPAATARARACVRALL